MKDTGVIYLHCLFRLAFLARRLFFIQLFLVAQWNIFSFSFYIFCIHYLFCQSFSVYLLRLLHDLDGNHQRTVKHHLRPCDEGLVIVATREAKIVDKTKSLAYHYLVNIMEQVYELLDDIYTSLSFDWDRQTMIPMHGQEPTYSNPPVQHVSQLNDPPFRLMTILVRPYCFRLSIRKNREGWTSNCSSYRSQMSSTRSAIFIWKTHLRLESLSNTTASTTVQAQYPSLLCHLLTSHPWQLILST